MNESHDRVAVVSAVRTAIGGFGGTLKDIEATELGSIVVGEALNRCKVQGPEIDEVIMGQVYTAGQGPNPARIVTHIQARAPSSSPDWSASRLHSPDGCRDEGGHRWQT